MLEKLRIGSVSGLLGVSNSMIRLLEAESGLVVERSQAGGAAQRLFSPSDIFTLAMQRRANRKRAAAAGGKEPARPTIIATYNVKGGCSKTTTAVELATHLQALSYRTLIIDLDPQASATSLFGYDPDLDEDTATAENIPEERVIKKTFGHLLRLPPVYTGKDKLKDVLKYPFGENGPHLIPSDLLAGGLEFMLFSAADRDRQFADFFESAFVPGSPSDVSDYDFILFDCAPAASFATRCATVACDILLAPVRLDALSVKGLSYLSMLLEQSQKTKRATIKMLAVPTFYRRNRTRITEQVQKLNTHYAEAVTVATIDDTEAVPRIQNLLPRAPIALRGPSESITSDYRDLALEIIDLVKQKEV